MLLKIALTKLISEHLTTESINTIACYTKELLGDNIFLQFSGVSKIEFHDFVDQLVWDSHLIILEHGMDPYKELAYTLVEELELINIHDVTFNWYSIIISAVEAMHEMNWKGNIEHILDPLKPFLYAMEYLLDEIFCHKRAGIEKNMAQMADNLESDSMIAFLQNNTPGVIRKIEDCTQNIGYYNKDLVHKLRNALFSLSQDTVDLQMTAYLKTNRGAINQLFTQKITVLDMKDLILYIFDILYGRSNFRLTSDFDDIIQSLPIWIDETDFPLFTNVSFSKDDSEVILEPFRQVFDALKRVELAAITFVR